MIEDSNEDKPEIKIERTIRFIKIVAFTLSGGYKVQPTPILYSIIIAELRIIKAEKIKNNAKLLVRGNIISGRSE